MGKIWPIDAIQKNVSTALYDNISSMAESPKKEGLIYVGTDDGLVQVTEDGGKNWRKVDKPAGVPENAYVQRIVASQHDAGTVYVAYENHQNGDFKPYLIKSADIAARPGSTSPATCPSAAAFTPSPKTTSTRICSSPAPNSASTSPTSAARSGSS